MHLPLSYGLSMAEYAYSLCHWHWQWLPFATVQTQNFVHSALAKTIAVNLVKILLCESSTPFRDRSVFMVGTGPEI